MAKDDIVIFVHDAVVADEVDVVGPFTKFISPGVQFILRMIDSIFRPPPPPPPSPPHPLEIVSLPETQLTNNCSPNCTPSPSQRPITTTEPPPVQTLQFHPVILMIRNQELGKSVLSLATPLTIAMLFSSSGNSHAASVHYVLTGLSIGCVAIFNGIAFRETVPRTANVVEQVGIITILFSFNGLLASALPLEFAWVPMLCAGFCFLPFIIAALPQPLPLPQDNNINDE